MAVISHGFGALIAAFNAGGTTDNVAKEMDFVVPMKIPIDTINDSSPTSGTNFTQDPLYLWKSNFGTNGMTMGAIKLGVHATGSYYHGQEYKEFIYFQHFNGGNITTLSTSTGDNNSSFNSSTDFTLTIQNASTNTLRVRQDKDHFSANQVKVYYLGGGSDVTYVGRNSGDPSGLGSKAADYDQRWYQSFWIV